MSFEGDTSPLEETEVSSPEGVASSSDKEQDEGNLSSYKEEGDVSAFEKDEESDSKFPGLFEEGCIISDHFSSEEPQGSVKINGNSEKSSKVASTGKPKQGKCRATIMVAGRARNGKSTALNNVFGLDLVAKASAKSVTQVVSVSEVTKKITRPNKDNEPQEEEVTLRVIDTPGLGATDIKKEDILKEMKKITQGMDYTLMYCFSVSPNTIILETDKAIVENLHLSLGKEVWKKCVLLFTFSDHAYLEFEDSKEEYIEHINNHAKEFENLLKSVAVDVPRVKPIFEYETPENLEKEESPSEIIAIPVNKKPKNSKSILPGMLKRGHDWTDIVFIELMKKTKEEDRVPFIYFRYPNLFLGAGAAGAGAAVGAGAGAMVGVLGGPIGVAAGAALGAVVGGAGGGVAGFAIKGMVKLVHLIKAKTNEKNT